MLDQTAQLFTSKAAELFLTMCSTKSFAKTAQLHEVTSSSISQSISALESSLGITLFDRSTRPVTLTPEAELLRQELSAQRARLETLLAELQLSNGKHPNLKLGLIESASLALGADLIELLSNSFGKIELLTNSIGALLNKLKSGEIELFLSSHSIAMDDSLHRVPLYQEPFVIVLPKSISGIPQSISWEWLCHCGLPLIQSPVGTYNRHMINQITERLSVSFNTRYEVESTCTAIDLVCHNRGWCIQSLLSLYPHRRNFDKILLIKMPAPELTRTLQLISLKGHTPSCLNILVDFFQNWFSSHLDKEFRLYGE